MVSDRDAATGPETLMNGAILDFQHAPWRGSSDGVIFLFPCSKKVLVLCFPECCSLDWIDLFSLCLQCGFRLQHCRLSECYQREYKRLTSHWLALTDNAVTVTGAITKL